ncbi:unnamed protein product [Spirodela intermedia]|uniref:Uncharacterized protein n=1 Tax=Spirodela intermedia TaxID=51605 RepID=A0A7I8J3M3_SPIIN|nr:unnamed protein product [Spirodela intermedia]CAA6664848.1 unnamed protein product [Spirodela intermedia]
MAAAPSPGYPVRSLPPSTPGRVILQGSSPWTTELFDCMDDPLNAVTTLLLPCVTFGQIAEIVDEGRSTCNTNGVMYGCVAAMIGMPCLISCGYRSRLRAKFDLVETPAPDWAVHFILEPCALCQEYRELRNRGFDPEIGWHANVAKSQGVALTPPKNQAMIG